MGPGGVEFEGLGESSVGGAWQWRNSAMRECDSQGLNNTGRGVRRSRYAEEGVGGLEGWGVPSGK